MPVTRTFKQSFSGGEISPEMFGRIADNKFQQGAALMRNFIAKPQGPAQNRPGFAFVKEVQDSTKATRLLSFTSATYLNPALFSAGPCGFATKLRIVAAPC